MMVLICSGRPVVVVVLVMPNCYILYLYGTLGIIIYRTVSHNTTYCLSPTAVVVDCHICWCWYSATMTNIDMVCCTMWTDQLL